MRPEDIAEIEAWIIGQGLDGLPETVLLRQFCERCCRAGLPLSRATTFIDTLHPIYEGRGFRWRNDGVAEDPMVEYGRSDAGEDGAAWLRSPFHHMETSGATALRRRLGPDDLPGFPLLERLRGEGQTDYLALLHRFASEGTLGGMDCAYSHWMTRHPDGFPPAAEDALRRLFPALALAIKCGALARIAETLVEVYLGRDPGRRVLSGRISRGVPERLHAVLWFSDLRGYTGISDRAPPAEIIPLLNDYADVVISAIHEAGGDVLKLMGDGTLAIFPAADPAQACLAALRAEADLRRRLQQLEERRRAEQRPVTQVYLGLHIGEVFYGNIGSADRLDFTVVGPAVNEVSRIASLCRSVDRHLLLSDAFVAATPEPQRRQLVSVGRFALRGVGRAQELHTLDPALL